MLTRYFFQKNILKLKHFILKIKKNFKHFFIDKNVFSLPVYFKKIII